MAETAYCDMILSGMVTEEQLVAAAKNYAEYCEIQKIDKIYYPNNFISKCVFDDFCRKTTRNRSGQQTERSLPEASLIILISVNTIMRI